MGGLHKISTFDVMEKDLQSACLKFKMETVFEVTPILRGHLHFKAWLLLTTMPSFSICLANVTPLQNKQEGMYSLREMLVLASMESSNLN